MAEEESAKVFKGFPLNKALTSPEGLRALADLVDSGDVAVAAYHLKIAYYSALGCEEGEYELVVGETFSPTGRGTSKI